MASSSRQTGGLATARPHHSHIRGGGELSRACSGRWRTRSHLKLGPSSPSQSIVAKEKDTQEKGARSERRRTRILGSSVLGLADLDAHAGASHVSRPPFGRTKRSYQMRSAKWMASAQTPSVSLSLSLSTPASISAIRLEHENRPSHLASTKDRDYKARSRYLARSRPHFQNALLLRQTRSNFDLRPLMESCHLFVRCFVGWFVSSTWLNFSSRDSASQRARQLA